MRELLTQNRPNIRCSPVDQGKSGLASQTTAVGDPKGTWTFVDAPNTWASDCCCLRRFVLAALAAACGQPPVPEPEEATPSASLPACDLDNGGITLPDGFCALVVADGLGAARHLTVAPNGDIYIAIRNQQDTLGGIVALRDTDGDGRMDVEERFGEDGGTAMKLHGGYLYLGRDVAIERYRMLADSLVPETTLEVLVTLPDQDGHRAKGIAFDGEGGMFVNVGAPSNACQPGGRVPEELGEDPCAMLDQHGGVWKFDEAAADQTQATGEHYATGMRQNFAMAWHPPPAIHEAFPSTVDRSRPRRGADGPPQRRARRHHRQHVRGSP